MTSLDSPAIGRKIAYLMHHDRAGLIAILSGTLPSCWPDLASAYLAALGCTEATDRQATVPGVLIDAISPIMVATYLDITGRNN